MRALPLFEVANDVIGMTKTFLLLGGRETGESCHSILALICVGSSCPQAWARISEGGGEWEDHGLVKILWWCRR